ncbi:MAG: 3',5'-cyclic-nucleotide phosphodiesterase [Deltaproteobacteria bacterium]|nr:3',5'-cyclic-nucleotide phosphodiesterase [Deltaproteobacteria bacterium]
MQIRVLDCHGGELLDLKTTCVQVGERLLIDAGALVSNLTIDQQVEIDDIVVSHSHFDHIKDLAMMADVVAGRRRRPVTIHGSPRTIEAIRKFFFNDRLWPDFTRIPSRKNPTFALKVFRPGHAFEVAGLSVLPVPVAHPVESMGFIVKGRSGAFAMSGDTGPTTRFWKELNRTENLRFAMVELSFPDEQIEVAKISGHMTPRRLGAELRKLERRDIPVFLYHFKPAFARALRAQLHRVGRAEIYPLSPGDTFTF